VQIVKEKFDFYDKLVDWDYRNSPYNEHWSSGPRPVKLCSDQ
jgi:hypothetical protein